MIGRVAEYCLSYLHWHYSKCVHDFREELVFVYVHLCEYGWIDRSEGELRLFWIYEWPLMKHAFIPIHKWTFKLHPVPRPTCNTHLAESVSELLLLWLINSKFTRSTVNHWLCLYSFLDWFHMILRDSLVWGVSNADWTAVSAWCSSRLPDVCVSASLIVPLITHTHTHTPIVCLTSLPICY